MRRVKDLIATLDAKVLERIALDTHADHKVLKLKSDLVLKMLLYTIISGSKATLSALMATFENALFQRAAALPPGTTTARSSIHDRLLTIPYVYFEQLYNHCLQTFSPTLQGRPSVHGKRLLRFDSTMVRIGAALIGISTANQHGKVEKKAKFTIGYDGVMAVVGRLFIGQRHGAEDTTLGPALTEYEGYDKESVAVVDRGLKDRAVFMKLDEDGVRFVGRLQENARHQIVCHYACGQDQQQYEDLGISLESDASVLLYNKSGKPCRRPLRLLRVRILKTGKSLWLVSNLVDEPGWLIAELYRRRWDVEVFFKFLKSGLGFSHLAARDENGLLVLLYATLIAALLIQVYRWNNGIKGSKEAQLRFENELQGELISEIIIRCGGDPHRWTHAP